MDYGTDYLLTDDDITFTDDGDIETVSGPACVAQDIDQEVKITQGSLSWDESAGSTIPLMLNDSESDSEAVIAELERVAIKDPRVDPETVAATPQDEKKYRLEFTPVSAIEPSVLDFDLSEGE